MVHPKLKELKGKYKDHYQLDFAGNHRMIYTVDDESKTVHVVYVGGHPDWDRLRRRDR